MTAARTDGQTTTMSNGKLLVAVTHRPELDEFSTKVYPKYMEFVVSPAMAVKHMVKVIADEADELHDRIRLSFGNGGFQTLGIASDVYYNTDTPTSAYDTTGDGFIRASYATVVNVNDPLGDGFQDLFGDDLLQVDPKETSSL